MSYMRQFWQDVARHVDQAAKSVVDAAEATNKSKTADLQRHLKRLGFDPGKMDGIMGPSTKRALTEFQKARGLPASGVLDAATEAKLNEVVKSVADAEAAAAEANQLVQELQYLLKHHRYYSGKFDGVMGPKTQQALMRFQVARGLPANGQIDDATIAEFKLIQREAAIASGMKEMWIDPDELVFDLDSLNMQTFVAVGSYADGAKLEVDKVEWSCSESEAVAIGAAGVLYVNNKDLALRIGKVMITAWDPVSHVSAVTHVRFTRG